MVILGYVIFTIIKKNGGKNPINSESDLAQNCQVCICRLKKSPLLKIEKILVFFHRDFLGESFKTKTTKSKAIGE